MDFHLLGTKEFDIKEFTSTYPTPVGNAVTLSNSSSGYATVNLPFSFPFYGNEYDQICIYADGYITFRNNTYNWPFLQNADYQVLNTEMIAPFRMDLTVSSLKVQAASDAVTICVQAKQADNSSSSVNFTVKLYPDGIIEYYYGSMNYYGNDVISAVSRGDSRIFQKTAVSGKGSAAVANRCFRFTPPRKVDFLTLSRDGVLAGTAVEAFTGLPVSVTCFDNNDQRQDTIVLLSCEYDNLLTITDLHISAGGDDVINPGEDVEISFTVRNMDSLPYNDCNIVFMTGNGHVQMFDNEEYFGYISGGNAYTLNRAIRFHVDESTPHLTVLDFAVTIQNDRYPQTSMVSLPVYSFYLEVESFAIKDGGNLRLDPNETDTLLVSFVNRSNLQIIDMQLFLHFDESDIIAGSQLNSAGVGEEMIVDLAHPIWTAAIMDEFQLIACSICYDVRISGVTTDPNPDNNKACIDMTRTIDIEDAEIASVSMFPNPASSAVTLSGVAGSQVQLFDLSGRRLFVIESAEENQQLDVSSLAEGLYIVRISDGGRSVVQKLNVIR